MVQLAALLTATRACVDATVKRAAGREHASHRDQLSLLAKSSEVLERGCCVVASSVNLKPPQ
jgi:hypothetical protein